MLPRFSLIFVLSLLAPISTPAQTTTADSQHDAQIAGIAGKFWDAYAQDPKSESLFQLGTSIREEMSDDGIEQIRITCPDGFVKIFWITPQTKRKVVNIESTGKTTAVIHYSDGSDSTSEFFASPNERPITYQVIRKKANLSP